MVSLYTFGSVNICKKRNLIGKFKVKFLLRRIVLIVRAKSLKVSLILIDIHWRIALAVDFAHENNKKNSFKHTLWLSQFSRYSEFLLEQTVLHSDTGRVWRLFVTDYFTLFILLSVVCWMSSFVREQVDRIIPI